MATIQRVSTYNILGVDMSEDLTRNIHIGYVFKKANTRLQAIRLKKKAGVATEDLVEIYCSLVRSVLEYCRTSLVGSSRLTCLSCRINSEKGLEDHSDYMSTLRPRMSLVFSVCLPVGSRPV